MQHRDLEIKMHTSSTAMFQAELDHGVTTVVLLYHSTVVLVYHNGTVIVPWYSTMVQYHGTVVLCVP